MINKITRGLTSYSASLSNGVTLYFDKLRYSHSENLALSMKYLNKLIGSSQKEVRWSKRFTAGSRLYNYKELGIYLK